MGIEEGLAAYTVEYAMDTAWYVSMVEKVVYKCNRMRSRFIPGNYIVKYYINYKT